MERVKSFQEMLKEGTFAATDAMLATGVAMVVIGILAILAPLARAAGVLYIARPVVGLIVLTVVFIAYLVLVGAFRIVMAFQLPRGSPGKSWGVVSGVVSLVLAYLAIAQMPSISLWLIGTFIGVSLIFAGIARISLARGFRKATDMLGAPPPAQRGAHA